MRLAFRNLPALRDRLQALAATLREPEPLLELADAQRHRILRRTAAGLNVSGHAFRPYTPAYRHRRQRHGRSGSVNLFYTGNMLASITPRVSRGGVSLVFASPTEAEKAARHQTTRPFFAFAPQDPPAILADLLRLLANR